MSTNTIKLRNPFSVLFAKGIDIEDNNYKFDEEQKESQSRSDKMMEQSSEPINVNVGKANKKGGFGKKINPIKDANTEKAMRAMLNKEEKNNSVEDRERE